MKINRTFVCTKGCENEPELWYDNIEDWEAAYERIGETAVELEVEIEVKMFTNEQK